MGLVVCLANNPRALGAGYQVAVCVGGQVCVDIDIVPWLRAQSEASKVCNRVVDA